MLISEFAHLEACPALIYDFLVQVVAPGHRDAPSPYNGGPGVWHPEKFWKLQLHVGKF